MLKKEKARYNMFLRVVQFIKDNAGDFPTGIVAAQLVILETIINTLQTLMGDQAAGFSDARFQFNSKATARENLREMLSEISETARSMVYQFPGINLKFQMPYNNNDAELLAKAKAFATDAATYEDDFIGYGLDAEFLGELTDLITAFEQSTSATGSPTDSHVEATADIGEEVRKGMICVRTMNGAVRNKYRGNPGKTAAWESASHVEREPKPPTPPLKKKDKDDFGDAQNS